jgi:hypothetical protein
MLIGPLVTEYSGAGIPQYLKSGNHFLYALMFAHLLNWIAVILDYDYQYKLTWAEDCAQVAMR